MKSSANRSVITSGTMISSPKDLFDFTKNINEAAAKTKGTSEPPINALYLESATIDDMNETILSDRLKQLDGEKTFSRTSLNVLFLGRIKDIRQYHQFDPKDQFTIFCRKTSNSLIVEEFTLRNDAADEQRESLRRIKTINDISIDDIVILQHGDNQHLAKVIGIRESERKVIAQCYEPHLSLSSYVRSFKKVDKDVNLSWKDIAASFIHPPTTGRRNQSSLSKEWFVDIHKCF